ncbi:hypothetical protein L1987_38832 [Smallanthus sonchifolius]|uniref:Uncharacterized protein n=1 Tax=Smallanthus sonchifolius TaxID=185202 RepID=A0ACB9HMU1_9ASTR|nr:hypothetical protein L1987_38832 [Smallanthus sonchifolius]
MPKRRLTEVYSDEINQEECASSVGSNHPIGEVITLSDDDSGEVESPPSKIGSSFREDLAGDKSEIRAFRSPVVFKKLNEDSEEDEKGNWVEKYGSMIVDDNGPPPTRNKI